MQGLIYITCATATSMPTETLSTTNADAQITTSAGLALLMTAGVFGLVALGVMTVLL
jgi:ABC-type uncharacterized transport system permease subunit